MLKRDTKRIWNHSIRLKFQLSAFLASLRLLWCDQKEYIHISFGVCSLFHRLQSNSCRPKWKRWTRNTETGFYVHMCAMNINGNNPKCYNFDGLSLVRSVFHFWLCESSVCVIVFIIFNLWSTLHRMRL